MKLIESNKNIYYLGWKSSDDLIKYLCATDIFIQIGSQSILFQQAISCRNMVILDQNINTEYLVSYYNGLLVENEKELENIINLLVDEKIDYKYMGERSNDFSKNELNYSKQSLKYIGEKID